MTNSTEALELAQLAFYALATIPAFYCFVSHGKHGLVGWLYVIAMCGLRLVGNGMAYHAASTGKPNATAAIINGIGLSPLLLAALGILHESNHSIQQTLPSFLGGFGLLIPHMVIAGGIGLAAASHANSKLLEAGLVVFAMGWVLVVALVALSWKANSARRRLDDEKKLLVAVAVAMPLIGVRIIYAVATAFADNSASGGSLPVRVIFGTLPEFLVMITYLSGGLVTHKLARNRQEHKPEPAYNTAYTSV
ncbi:hypothetical protein N7492_001121 [Penicillium capsulatum]|uniref:DUF7702 domain-containing protein n=1 Tax=Penicillium capsulatum TaxID=69766 RepID=A0A9W9LZL6_9EURO|nr:hypothetical protein N7492_001121 [Penicillium capsulatum]KAJ6129822.1 hypothetical protein N7512_002602 [Penicillium capsulatum]